MKRSMLGNGPTLWKVRARYGLALLTTIIGSLIFGTRVDAQITTEALIGDAVSEVGNRYPEVENAITRFTNRDVLGARALLDAAKKKDPSLPPTDLTLAKMYFMSGNGAAARTSLEATVNENPTDPEAYLVLADQAMNERRSIEAEALYEKAMELIANFNENAKRKRNFEIRARTGRALVAEQRQNWTSAANDLQALLQVDPDNAVAHYRLGQALFMQNKTKEGYDEFVRARELNNDLPNPYVATALMYDRLGDASRAQQAFERAVSGDRNNAAVLAAYAQWLMKTGSVQKAEATLEAARQLEPESLEVLILSGVAANMAKKMKPAEDYFVEALRISPTNAGVINQLALLLIDQPDDGKRRRALEFANMNARLNSQSAETQITLAWVLYQLGRLNEANTALRNGLQLGNLGPDSSFLVAKMMVDQKQNEPAKQLLESALDAKTPGIFVHQQEAQALLDSLGT